jgi:AcrR family transcriptional regulator
MATRRAKSIDSGRLDIAAWTEAALDLLAIQGIDGVRVELLAKQLEVTKGSFYWHFKDRDALHETMLAHWRRQATLQLIERLERDGASPELRLRRLLRLPISGRRSQRAADVELAVRLWGRRDPRARAALEEVDQLRLRYIGKLLTACGVPERDVTARAIIGYSYMRVAATLIAPDRADTMELCETLLIGANGAARVTPSA